VEAAVFGEGAGENKAPVTSRIKYGTLPYNYFLQVAEDELR
jgi:hypothetical protein